MVDPEITTARARELAAGGSFLTHAGKELEGTRFAGKNYLDASNRPEGATSSEVKTGSIDPNAASERRTAPEPSSVAKPATAEPSSVTEPKKPVSSDEVTPSSPTPPVANAPETIRIELDGKAVDMPIAQVNEMVGKAAKAATTMQDAEAIARSGLEGAAFTKWYHDPNVSDAQRAIIDAVLAGKPLPTPNASDPELNDDDLAPRPAQPVAQNQEALQELRNIVTQLVGSEVTRRNGEAETALQKQMLQYPAFAKSQGLFDLALPSIKDHLAANPGADQASVVAAHAARFTNWVNAAEKEPDTPAPTVAPTTPAATRDRSATDGSFTGDDLLKNRGGPILAAVEQRLRDAAAG